MQITVLYFAAVRDLVGTSQEQLDLPPQVATVEALAAFLTQRHARLAGHLGHVRFARNEDFVSPSDTLNAGDVVALIPPVAGG